MSTFAVFAISKIRVDAIAAQLKIELSEAEKIALNKCKPQQVSPLFDAPQFASEWIELANKTGLFIFGTLSIRAKRFDPKKGRAKFEDYQYAHV